jgi:hypothetical protein
VIVIVLIGRSGKSPSVQSTDTNALKSQTIWSDRRVMNTIEGDLSEEPEVVFNNGAPEP